MCLKNINAGAAFPGRREDFPSDAAWQHWRTVETSHLSQLMMAMMKFNPDLAKSAPSDMYTSSPPANARPPSMYSPSVASRHGSFSSHRSAYGTNGQSDDMGDYELGGDDEVPVGHNFTYIPPNPKKFYRR